MGDPSTNHHYHLRNYAASLIKLVYKRFGESSHTIRPRMSQALPRPVKAPRHILSCGAIVGLAAIGGRESVRVLVLFVLNQMMNLTHALLENENLLIGPYVRLVSPRDKHS